MRDAPDPKQKGLQRRLDEIDAELDGLESLKGMRLIDATDRRLTLSKERAEIVRKLHD